MRSLTVLSATWIKPLCLALAMLGLLSGCATSQKEMMPVEDGTSMKTLWRDSGQGGGTGNTAWIEARQTLRRPLSERMQQLGPYHPYTRHAANAIRSQFPRLPNPDLVMYVYPHLAGDGEQVPVPGYSTVFPLYQRRHYAQPGEVAWPWPEKPAVVTEAD